MKMGIDRKRILQITGVILLFTLFSCDLNKDNNNQYQISFNSDVRPILNNKCIGCHGGVKKSGGLSFLIREEAIVKTKSGEHSIIPGNAKESLLMARIKSNDPEFRMPLNEAPLSQNEIKVLENWIDEGAQWQDHWAYEKPVQPSPPGVDYEEWVRNPIDQFILAKIEKAGIQPSEAADKETLIRRVSLDLIGLPPSIEEVENFINDQSIDAFERVVDRLLDSPRFGEHWAAMWMDLARYADSKGYEKDDHREMWKYRDWLIDAFNENMSFDQFTVQQLAGDLIEDANMQSRIATAFHRNTMNNDEGGTIDEEYRMAAVIDRVNTTWDVWQGTTFSCVQCHSHPYDPLMHKEYYEFLSFFNQTADKDLPNEFPTMTVYSKEEEQKIAQIESRMENVDPSDTEQIRKMAAQKDSIKGSLLPIMEELQEGEKRTTHVFVKGNRLDLGEEVESKVPQLFPQLPKNVEANRLAMAQWLVDAENPLTARVTVNRFWSNLFGRGIVETEEDFGSQGFMPTHPYLLDWLAVEFQEKMKWDVKSLLKLIVSSATYQQSSKLTRELLELDPDNKFLARGSRVRLSAEEVRDCALFVSGLLSDKMYGKSVMPYQPEGVWQTVYSGAKWKLSKGEDAYRRALYTYWRRTSPYPSMISFDVPSREVCVMRRIPTNTPLQALVNLNDPVYIEAANALGQWMLSRPGDLEEKISKGHQRVLSKIPDDQQLKVLIALYENIDKVSENETNSLSESITDEKEIDPKIELSSEELRMKNISLDDPMSYVAHALLNLDAFLTKQ